MFDSSISGVSRDCCESQKCSLEFRWRYDTSDLWSRNFILADLELPLLTRSLADDHRHLLAISWNEANKMCASRGRRLPILNSPQAVKGLTDQIQPFAIFAPVSSVFIGIRKQVTDLGIM